MSEPTAQVAAEQAVQPAIRLLGDMQRINPVPGDVFVLRLDSILPMDTIAKIKQMLREQLPQGVHVIALEKGMTLECISAQQAELELAKLADKAKK